MHFKKCYGNNIFYYFLNFLIFQAHTYIIIIKRRILDQNNHNRQPVVAATCGSWQPETENVNRGGGWIANSGGWRVQLMIFGWSAFILCSTGKQIFPLNNTFRHPKHLQNETNIFLKFSSKQKWPKGTCLLPIKKFKIGW